MIKYIFFLTIDALSFSRINKDISPVIYDLSTKGINCVNAFSNGQPTQMAFPSIFSSTMPLDSGGYDHGVRYREITLPEVMRSNGFKTVGFSTVNFLGKYYFYDRGFDELYEIYNIKRFWNSFYKNYFSYFVNLLNDDLIKFDDFCDIVLPSVVSAYEYILIYCEKKKEEVVGGRLSYSQIVHGYNFEYIESHIRKELALLLKDPKRYLLHYADFVARYNNIISRSRHGDGAWGRFKACLDRAGEDSMVKVQNKVGLSFPYTLKRYDHFVGAEYLKNCIVNWVDASDKRPFFLWAHFLDIHEGNYTSKKIQLPPLSVSFWRQRVALGGKNFRRLHTEYVTNEALRYVDRQIGDLLRYLVAQEMMDQSLVIITADHGMESRPLVRSGHKATLFHEEFIKIPMIFYSPQVKAATVANLCSHLDLAPTVLDVLGVESINGFQGVPVYSDVARDRERVLSENLGRGPCDFGRKKINIAIRTKRHKYIWSEGTDLSGVKLYDLENDPDELLDIHGETNMSRLEEGFRGVAVDRCRQIRSGTFKDVSPC